MRMRDFDIVFSGLSLGEHQFLYNLNDTFFTLYDYTEHSKLKATAEVTLHKHNTFLELNRCADHRGHSFLLWGHLWWRTRGDTAHVQGGPIFT